MSKDKIKKNKKNIKSQINSDQKKKGQNRSNHKPKDTIVFLKVRHEFLCNEREKRGERKKTSPQPNSSIKMRHITG
jgi:hypothetical protein